MAANLIQFVYTGVDKMSGANNRVVSSLGKLAKTTIKTTAVILAVNASIEALAHAGLVGADKVGKFAERIGVSATELSRLQFAAKQSGIETVTFNLAMQRMTRRVAEAAQGTGEAKDALKALHINAKTFTNLGLEKQFEILQDRLSRVESPANRLRLAFKLFDSEGTSVIQMLNKGAPAIAAMKAEADKFGLTLSGRTIKTAEDYTDSLGRLKGAFTGLQRTLGTELGPAMAKFFNDLAKWIAENKRAIVAFLKTIWDLIRGLFELGKTVAEFPMKLKKSGDQINSVNKALKDGTIHTFNNVKAMQLFLDTANKMDLSKLSGSKFGSFAAKMKEDITAVQDRLKELSGKEVGGVLGNMFKEGVVQGQKFFEKLKGMKKGSPLGIGPTEEQRRKAEEEYNKYEQQIINAEKRKYEIIANFAATETDRMKLEHEKRVLEINEFYENGIIPTVKEKEEILTAMKKDYDKRMHDHLLQSDNDAIKFNAMTFKERIKFTGESLATITGMLANHSKSWFKINQAVGIANAIVSTHVGVTKALEAPPPGSWVMAAITLAKGLASIATIRAQKFGGAAHGGLTNVPKESTFLLDKGERVLSPNQNKDLTGFLSNQNNGNGGSGITIENINIEILPNATNADLLLTMSQEDWNELVARKIYKAFEVLNEQGIRPYFA